MAGKLNFLKTQGDTLFSKRGNLMNLWQALCDNFYPERADFTVTRDIGDEFASGLMSSYPVLARRDLGNSFGSMLRPTSKEWFKIVTDRMDKLDGTSKEWLEWASKLQKNAMYDPRAMFVRATKEGDHDFATLGQAVISCEVNLREMALLYRCWHVRDCAWLEDEVGQVGTMYRKWKAPAATLIRLFGDKCHRKVKEAMTSGKPFQEFMIWHVVMPTEVYDDPDKNIKQEKVSIFYDVQHQHEMECVGRDNLGYIVPRWQTVSGSQYAYSPASIVALPEARLIQSMTRVLLEAGEKAVDPPMVATQDMIRSDISIYAGGVTWVDADYDERLGDVLRPLSQNKTGIPTGIDMARDVKNLIHEAFYLNKLSLPPQDVPMTAYETGQRVQEYIRQALPLFEPMEVEYNGAICDLTFQTLMSQGAFGNPLDHPKQLRGANISFQFESPLREATERAKGQRFMESKEMLAVAADLDPSSRHLLKPIDALRDVFEGIGVPFKWVSTEAEMEAAKQADAQAAQAQDALAQMGQAAEIAEKMGKATQGKMPAPDAAAGIM